jgi:hypothetical protein
MTFDEAVELAKAIEGNSQFAVIAIGRFVMSDELSTVTKQTLPWGVSVAWLSDHKDRVVCFKESDWTDFALAHAPKPQAKPVETKVVKPSRVEEEQPLLF